jgi:hypothetical protein
MRLRRTPWRTSRVPTEVNDLLPKLVWIIKCNEAERLRHLMDSGSIDILFREGEISRYGMAMSLLLSGLMAVQATGAEVQVTDEQRNELLEFVRIATFTTPVNISECDLESWLIQVTGGTAFRQYASPREIDAYTFWILLSIAAGAAIKRHWLLRDIEELYTVARTRLEYGHKIS